MNAAAVVLRSFSFEHHPVRTLLRDGEPWFVAADVCAVLGYTNASKAIADHLDADDRSNEQQRSPVARNRDPVSPARMQASGLRLDRMSMKDNQETCKTCAHWRTPCEETRSKDYTAHLVCAPIDPDTCDEMALPFAVGICSHPAQTFAERPVESNGFGVVDGSTYYARLITAEDFGCNRHSAK